MSTTRGRALAGPPATPVPHPKVKRARLPAGSELRRIFWTEPHNPTATAFRTYGPTSRFDHHRRPGPFPACGQDGERGILYAAPEFACCVTEVFGDGWAIETTGARIAVLRLTAALTLLDLRGKGASHAGSLHAVSSDGGREATQDWGRYWYEHPELADLDGLLYPSAHTGQDAVAVWERADGKLECLHDWPLNDPEVLPELLVVAAELEMPVDLP